jgi:hypothetical protein
MNVRYRVELSQTERAELTALVSKGKQPGLRFTRWYSRSNALDSSDASRGSPTASKCSLIRNAMRTEILVFAGVLGCRRARCCA